MITAKQHALAIAAAYTQGYEDGKSGRRRGQQADSFRRRYNDDSRKGEKFRNAESLRKKKWQASPAGKASNRERQRRWQEKQRQLRGSTVKVTAKTTNPVPAVQKVTAIRKTERRVTGVVTNKTTQQVAKRRLPAKNVQAVSAAVKSKTVRAKAPMKALSHRKIVKKQGAKL
jgi:hypothetical protein